MFSLWRLLLSLEKRMKKLKDSNWSKYLTFKKFLSPPSVEVLALFLWHGAALLWRCCWSLLLLGWAGLGWAELNWAVLGWAGKLDTAVNTTLARDNLQWTPSCSAVAQSM